jgi:hypothetical protein
MVAHGCWLVLLDLNYPFLCYRVISQFFRLTKTLSISQWKICTSMQVLVILPSQNIHLTLGIGLVVKLLFCIFKISNKLPYDYAARDLTSYRLLAVPIAKRLQIVIGFGHKNPIPI